ncbi:hypothetical protein M2175_002382 [Bradyrhizobium elkanii]|nr:hypothetical protein [Bradyrhizobium elkanii]MCS3967904.1 hypothetical protein [Bradyrhizobium japonicum]
MRIVRCPTGGSRKGSYTILQYLIVPDGQSFRAE